MASKVWDTYMCLSAIDEISTRPGINLFIDYTIIHSVYIYIYIELVGIYFEVLNKK